MAMTVEQAYQILSKFHGYTGPRTKRAISQFVNARDLPVAVKNRGGLIGMQEGGDTEKKEKPSGETVETETPGGDRKDDVGKPEENFVDYQPKKNPPPPNYTAEDVKEGQKQLVGGAFTDPSAVVDKATVDTVDPDTT